MSQLTVSFTLDDQDLSRLRKILKHAGAAAKGRTEAEVAAGALELVKRARESKPPSYVIEHIETLETLVKMAGDKDWPVPAAVRAKLLTALAYFSNPSDLIPDRVPGLGFLDDAIMIELVARDLRHETKVYREFERFRATAEQRPWTAAGKASLEKRLVQKRAELRAKISAAQAKDAHGPRLGSFRFW